MRLKLHRESKRRDQITRQVMCRTVTVEDTPISFSLFSSKNCTFFSHFSFNNFIAIAFPDLAEDLYIQI